MPILGSYNKKVIKNPYLLKEKVYFSISSEGFGHSSRALAIAKALDPEQVIIGSYSYAFDRVKALGYPCKEVSQELKLIGERGAFDVGKTIIKNHSWALSFNQLVKEEIEIIKKSGASCVVADGRLVPVMAADKLSLPCVVITNQSAFYPFFKSDSALIRVFGKSFDWIMKTWLSSAEEIMIPDFPPPYTICLPNLSHNSKVMKRTRFVGPLVSWDRNEITAVEHTNKSTGRPYIVVTLGGHAYRRPLFDCVIETAKLLPDIDFDVFTTFETDNIPDNVRLVGLVPNLAEYLKAADLVITQAGHSTAMELLTLGKPAVIVPDLRQTEQENNAKRMAELDLAKIISYDDLSTISLIENINKVLNESKYAENAEKFAVMAEKIQGRREAAKVLKEYAGRLLSY